MEQDKVLEIKNRIIGTLANASSLGVTHLESKYKEAQKELVQQKRHINEEDKKLKNIKKELDVIKEGTKADFLEIQVQEILDELPIEYAWSFADDHVLVFKTEMLYRHEIDQETKAFKPTEDKIGKFIISLDFRGDYKSRDAKQLVKARNITYHYNQYDHCYITRGEICWGTLSNKIKPLVVELRFFELLEATLDLIRQPYANHPYIDWYEWTEERQERQTTEEETVENILSSFDFYGEATQNDEPDQDELVRQALREHIRTAEPILSDEQLAENSTKYTRMASREGVEATEVAIIEDLDAGRGSVEECKEKLGETLINLAHRKYVTHDEYSAPSDEDILYFILKQVLKPTKGGETRVLMTTDYIHEVIDELKVYEKLMRGYGRLIQTYTNIKVRTLAFVRAVERQTYSSEGLAALSTVFVEAFKEHFTEDTLTLGLSEEAYNLLLGERKPRATIISQWIKFESELSPDQQALANEMRRRQSGEVIAGLEQRIRTLGTSTQHGDDEIEDMLEILDEIES